MSMYVFIVSPADAYETLLPGAAMIAKTVLDAQGPIGASPVRFIGVCEAETESEAREQLERKIDRFPPRCPSSSSPTFTPKDADALRRHRRSPSDIRAAAPSAAAELGRCRGRQRRGVQPCRRGLPGRVSGGGRGDRARGPSTPLAIRSTHLPGADARSAAGPAWRIVATGRLSTVRARYWSAGRSRGLGHRRERPERVSFDAGTSTSSTRGAVLLAGVRDSALVAVIEWAAIRRAVLLSLVKVYPNFAEEEDIGVSLSEPVLHETLDWLERSGLVERWDRSAKASRAGAAAVWLEHAADDEPVRR